MSTKLYVGNLADSVKSSDLHQLFSQYGGVENAQVIGDRHSGHSRGFGFVEMGLANEAEAAVAGLDGQVHEGRPLSVSQARTRIMPGTGGSLRGE